jgi:alanine dehydrogenase
MSVLSLGVTATSRKENEGRVALHPRHLAGLAREIRPRITFERGYGRRFGVADREIEELGFHLASRGEVMGGSDVVLLPKPLAEDLREMREGAVLWGWPHCVQQREITQAAIDRRLTLIAFEAMFHWGGAGEKQLHTFYKNNELAGYCGILHALQLLGRDGFYGPPRRAAVLGFGSVSRGAVYALHGRGISDVTVYTQRPPHLVRDQIFGCSYRRMKRGAAGETMISEAWDGRERPLIDDLVTADVIVNGTLQDTDNPLMFLRPDDEKRLRPGALIVDVSCDLGMGFPFARPTSFAEPTFQAGRGVYYAVDHTPTYLWDSATWEISKALLPYLEAVLAGPDGWAAEPTLTRAVEIRDGVIRNAKILSFQKRAAEYPHPASPAP